MKRISGIVLIVVAAISLLISVWGLVQIWTLRQPVADAAVAGVDLFAETLDTTSDALKVTSESLQSASDSVTMIERTSLSVAQTMSTTRTTVGSFANLMGKDLPTSIDATRTALKSAQSSAVVVDNVLMTLSRIPLINIQYNPAVPLSAALGDVAKSLDNLPPTFSTIERNLNTTGDSLDQVITNLNELPKTTQPVQRNIVDAQQVVARYQSQVDRLQKLIQPIKASLPMTCTVITLGLTFLVFWLGVLQVQVLLRGLELFRGGHNPSIES
jgi:methyl-accepting chemotaxis protein